MFIIEIFFIINLIFCTHISYTHLFYIHISSIYICIYISYTFIYCTNYIFASSASTETDTPAFLLVYYFWFKLTKKYFYYQISDIKKRNVVFSSKYLYIYNFMTLILNILNLNKCIFNIYEISLLLLLFPNSYS